MAANAARHGSATGVERLATELDSQRRERQGERTARRSNPRTQPRAVVWGTPRHRPLDAPRPVPPHGLEGLTDGLCRVEAIAHNKGREQGVGPSTRRAPAPSDPDPLGTPLVAHEPRVARPERHGTETRGAIGPRDLDFSAGRRVGVDGLRAGPYDGHRWQHRLGPLPWPASTCSGRGPSRSGTAHPRRRRPQRAKALPTSSITAAKDRASILRQSRR